MWYILTVILRNYNGKDGKCVTVEARGIAIANSHLRISGASAAILEVLLTIILR